MLSHTVPKESIDKKSGLGKPFDESNSAIRNLEFKRFYQKFKKEKVFPSERKVDDNYFFEVEKELKKKENPTAKTISTVLDIGMKAALLYCLCSTAKIPGVEFPKNILNVQTFLKTFTFASNIIASQNLIEEAARKITGVETFRHGTSLTNYAKIQLEGADPKKGGSSSGSSAGAGDQEFIDNSRNYFHVFVDSYGNNANMFGPKEVVKRELPRFHAYLAGLQIGKKYSDSTKNYAGGIASLIFSPNIRFYYHPDNLPGQFVYDREYGEIALKTPIKINHEHMGMKGIIHESITNFESTKRTIVEKLTNPKEIAFVGACLFGAYIFARFAQNDLLAIMNGDITKIAPKLTQEISKNHPEFWEILNKIGINCSKSVIDLSQKLALRLILPVLYYSINIAK